MKNWLFALICLFSCCCAGVQPVPHNPVVESEANTVALMIPKEQLGGAYGPVCAGVWVAEEWILTANHCVMDDAVTDEITGEEITPAQPVPKMHFVTTQEHNAPLYNSTVLYRDAKNDLALLLATTWPVHTFAQVAPQNPVQGEAVHIVGHPLGLLWTYTVGTVSRIGTISISGDRIWLVLETSVYHGNSGGGAFDDQGRLVGVCDALLPFDGQSLFIPAETNFHFLKQSHL